MKIRHWTNYFSWFFGKLADISFPGPIQALINKIYVYLFNVDLSEFNDVSSYKTLNKLFTRELKKERRIDIDPSSFIAPADSIIMEMGKLEKDTLFQIKGIEYSVKGLLTVNAVNIDNIINGHYINFYLSSPTKARGNFFLNLSS